MLVVFFLSSFQTLAVYSSENVDVTHYFLCKYSLKRRFLNCNVKRWILIPTISRMLFTNNWYDLPHSLSSSHFLPLSPSHFLTLSSSHSLTLSLSHPLTLLPSEFKVLLQNKLKFRSSFTPSALDNYTGKEEAVASWVDHQKFVIVCLP